jgi:TPR repeat protein
MLKAAQAGDAGELYHVAQYCFNRYENDADGKGMVDFAMHCYHESIRRGFRGAMYNLGSIYYHGHGGVAADRTKAYWLYLYSGVTLASGELGVYYAKGEVVEQDFEMAFKLFAKCALQMILICYGSFANLARMYREGIYVDKDEPFAKYLSEMSGKAEKAIDGSEDSGDDE